MPYTYYASWLGTNITATFDSQGSVVTQISAAEYAIDVNYGSIVNFIVYNKNFGNVVNLSEIFVTTGHDDGQYCKQTFGNFTTQSLELGGNGGTSASGYSKVYYKATSYNFSADDPDFVDYCYYDNDRVVTRGGFVLRVRLFFRIVAPNSFRLHSRMSALKNRAMFTLNVKDEGGWPGNSLVQFFTSLDSTIHEDEGDEGVGDLRFNQSYVFGPFAGDQCSISIKNTEYPSEYLPATRPFNRPATAGSFTSLIQANGFNAFSDYRIKSNIESLGNTHTVDNIRVVKYNSTDNSTHFGVIAHELSEVYPELVTGKKDEEKYQSVAYLELIPILINEIQMIKKELLVMKNDNNQLRSQILERNDDMNR